MKVLLTLLLLFHQGNTSPDKWVCNGVSEKAPDKQLERIKPSEMKDRVVSCVVPHLTGTLDARSSVAVEVLVDEKGNVRCARVVGRKHPIIRETALDAVKKWKFKPLMVDGKVKSYVGILVLIVSWDFEEAEKQCPKEKRA